MRFALMTEPQQGLSYDEILALADTAEAAGIEAFFRSDHYTSFPGEAGLPTTDAWATLAGLARDTDTIHLGTLVSPVTFRLPGPFAKLVATVDEMSGGRVEIGMGAGWNEREHAELGIPFPPIAERYDMLEASLAIVVGQGAWEDEMLEDTRELDAILRAKDIPAIVDYWGHDVDHDWPWWRVMLPHYLERLGV